MEVDIRIYRGLIRMYDKYAYEKRKKDQRLATYLQSAICMKSHKLC